VLNNRKALGHWRRTSENTSRILTHECGTVTHVRYTRRDTPDHAGCLGIEAMHDPRLKYYMQEWE
jgi:hypothetical protein